MARIELWNGDICDLEVDAIVNAANLSLWMATGVGGAIKRAGGDEIEFAAVRQAPVALGGAVVTPAGRLAAARSSTPCRSIATAGRAGRSSRPPCAARWPAPASIDAASIAFPALGTGVGGFPLDEAARITIDAVRDELPASPSIQHVIFALRGAAAYAGLRGRARGDRRTRPRSGPGGAGRPGRQPRRAGRRAAFEGRS